MKLRVFQFIGGLGDGGAETLVKDYALLLKEDGYDVMIITTFPPDKSTANYRALYKNGVPIVSLYKKSCYVVRLFHKFFGKIVVPVLFRILVKKYKPDVIHVHLSNLYALLSNRKVLRGIKLFYTCHSLPEYLIGIEQKKEHKAVKYLLKYCHLKLIALHDDMRKEINKMFGISNTLTINNGIDFDKYRAIPHDVERRLREETKLSKDDFVVGHVGRFSKVKNHTFLLDVFYELVKIKDNAKLLLVGVGLLESEIKRKICDLGIDEKVVILHHRTDVADLLRLCDVFVFPSFYEGFGIVLLEAQVSGLKCLISDTINSSSFLADKAIPVSLNKTAKDWACLILDDSIRNQKHGDISKFNLRNIIKQIENLYNEDSCKI